MYSANLPALDACGGDGVNLVGLDDPRSRDRPDQRPLFMVANERHERAADGARPVQPRLVDERALASRMPCAGSVNAKGPEGGAFLRRRI